MRRLVVLILLQYFQIQCASAQQWYRKYQAIDQPEEREIFLKRKENEFITEGDQNALIQLYLLNSESFKKEGDLIAAESTLLKAKKLVDTKSSQDNLFIGSTIFRKTTVFDVYDQLGRLYLKSGNPERGLALFQESLIKRNSIFPSRSVHRILPLLGIATYHLDQNNLDSAMLYLKKGLHELDKSTSTFFNFGQVELGFYEIMVQVAIQKNDFKIAENALRKTLRSASSGIRRYESVSQRNVSYASILNLKANYFLSKRDAKTAEYYIKKARLFVKDSTDISLTAINVLKTESLINWLKEDYQTTYSTFAKLLRFYSYYIEKNLSALTESEKDQFFKNLKSDIEVFNYFASYTIKYNKGINVSPLLYNTTIQNKALLLTESVRLKRTLESSKNDTLISKLKAWKATKEMLAASYFVVNNENRIDSLNRQAFTIERELTRELNTRQGKRVLIHWEDIINNLQADEAAMEILRVERPKNINSLPYDENPVNYLSLIVRKDFTKPDVIFLNEGHLLDNRYLFHYRNSIRSQINDTLSYLKYWSEFDQKLSGVDRLYLSTDGVYNLLNLNTLKNYKDDQYLIDKLNITYVTNTSDILKTQSSKIAKKVILFGRPQYGIQQNNVTEEGKLTRGLYDHDIYELRKVDFADLPGTESELTSIASLLADNYTTEIFLGVTATEKNVKKVESPLVLHIASHGYFIENNGSNINPFIRSGIIFSGVNSNYNNISDDGILTALEAANLNLSETKLVVLSACETGLGDVRNGEGVYGLQRAFTIAGAENLIMSLWKVDDSVTSELMIHFYQAWSTGHSIGEAFKMAQTKVRSKNENPYYWGAFILLGHE